MVSSTLKLGISILNGGNADVQQKMLDYLKDKKEVGFFQSIQALMQTCSVLDLNAFERQNKAEGLGMVNEDGTGEALFWASLSPGHPLPSGSASTPMLPSAPFLQGSPSPRASPDSPLQWSPVLPHHGPHPWVSFCLGSPAHHHMKPALNVPPTSRPGWCSLINVPNPG
ncbi:hypothetical protein HPG69_015596 [Diceros bicornis minor]|uniref:Uncharacterized protein n=1 Tax=Diceros bicornis minor TaxID=77932 RepID=A0A7J7FER4_DICBM|nr:hypothetical protein HPG69_015596 [Diceros bicornis minor]